MPKSMTGFGRGKSEGAGYVFEIEMKAVNHRFLEVIIRSPRSFNIIDEKIKKMVKDNFFRGRIEIFVNLKETEEKKSMVKVDKELALSYDKFLKELALSLNTNYETDIYKLSALPEVITLEEEETDMETLWSVLEKALQEAMTELLEMRTLEGKKLSEDLNKKITGLKGLIQEIAARAPEVILEYRDKLKERIQSLQTESVVDESRLATEVAFFADRASIEEELVRLYSHFSQFEASLTSNDPIGRKLDFLMQEMNREVNTIGSKANDLAISRSVVEAKSELEKIREQVQNIE